MKVLSARSRWGQWMVPVAAVAVLAGGVAVASRSDSATPPLPPRTAEQLLADVRQANVAGLSGTVVETARLGLPSLPSLSGRGGSADLTGLLSGSHTVRVWYAGSDKARIAVSGTLAESDIIRNGRDLWVYQSAGNTVAHTHLPANGPAEKPVPKPGGATLSPQDAARQAVAAITPTTSVRVERTGRVAGRDVYQLRLSPKDPRLLVDSVLLAVDGQTHVPLRVQVFARASSTPAFETGFTDLQLRAPAADVFNFTPPSGAKVTEQPLRQPSKQEQQRARARLRGDLAAARPAVIGDGWMSVLVLRNAGAATAAGSEGGSPLDGLLQAATPVRGAFGHGRLLRTVLVTGLLTDDGRLYVGAVTPEVVEAAATRPLSAAKPLTGQGATP